MKKLFNMDGTPTKFGLGFLKFVKREIKSLFDTLTVEDLSDTQVRLLGSWLNKTIGDEVANVLAKRE